MIKKMYEKPTTKVYELKHQPQLLAGSAQVNASLYNNGEWTEEDI